MSLLKLGFLKFIFEPCFELYLFFFHCSVETINDGNFHIVELLTLDSSLSLSVDGGSPKVITNLSKQSTLNFDSPLYVGGELPSKSVLLIIDQI